MSPEEISYYRERASIERQSAAQSTNPHVIEIHEKLADLYEKLVEMEGHHEPSLRLVGG